MGLIGLLFNLVTFPGILLSHLAESIFASAFGAPTYSVRLRDDVTDEEFAAVCEEVGLDATTVGDLDPEALSGLSRQKLSMLNQVVEVSQSEEFEDGEVLIHYSGMDSFSKVLLVAALPFVVSSVLCFGVFLVGLPVGAILVGLLGSEIPWWIVLWLGVSFGAHAFPNAKATRALWTKSSEASLPLKLVGYPFVVVAKVANLLRILWLDAIYALILFWIVEFGILVELLGFPTIP